jgi:hypothetical protein
VAGVFTRASPFRRSAAIGPPTERRRSGHGLGRGRAAAQQARTTTPRNIRERLGQAGSGRGAAGGGAGISPAPTGTVRHLCGPDANGAAAIAITPPAEAAPQVLLHWSRPAGSLRARLRTRPAQPRPRSALNVPPADRHGAISACFFNGLGGRGQPPTRAGSHPAGRNAKNI